MEYTVYEKDKRIPPRLYPWWLILVGFVFGVIATLMFTASRPPEQVDYYPGYDGNIWIQAPPAPGEMGNRVIIAPESELDTFQATATAMVNQATVQAASANINPVTDPIALTATSYVAQATQAAQQGR